MRNHTNILFYH